MQSNLPQLKVGMLVINPKKPEWGPGKLRRDLGDLVEVWWRDVPEKKPGDALKMMDLRVVPLEPASVQTDAFLDHLPDKPPSALKPRLTVTEGIAAFLKRYPKGFRDSGYLRDERDYKWAAHEHYQQTLGRGVLRALLDAGKIEDARHSLLQTAAKVNFLSMFESAAFRDGLHADDECARRFLIAVADAAEQPPSQPLLDAIVEAVGALPVAPGKLSPLKWTIVTMIPYLALPDDWMFLKPEVTKGCAMRMAFELRYDARPNWTTYSRVLTMCEALRAHLKPHGARDLLDIQSFIWVIGVLG